MPLMKNTYVLYFTNGMFSWYTFFKTDAKIKAGDQLRGQLISLRASLHEPDRTGLIDNPALKSQVQ